MSKKNTHFNLSVAIFVLIFFLSPLLVNAEEKTYTGCAENAEDARLELGRNIFSQLASVSTTKTTVENVSFIQRLIGESVSDKSTEVRTAKSRITLCDIQMTTKDGNQCASVTYKSLVKCAKNNIDTQLGYASKNLPNNDNKLEIAQDWLTNIANSEGLYTVTRPDLNKNKLEKLKTIEKQLQKVLDKQFVMFEIVGANIQIKIDDEKRVRPNRYQALKIGKHSYEISAPGHCVITGKFSLSARNKKTVSVNLSDYEYPKITFTSNQGQVSLSVDGIRTPVGKTNVFKRCGGVVAYAYTYQGQTADGKITLSPGMKKTVRETFLSAKDITKNRALAASYGSGTLWQAQFVYMNTSRDANGVDSLSGIRLAQTKLKKVFRWGYDVLFLKGEKDSYAVEANMQAKLQLLNFGKSNMPLYLGPMIFLPHIGAELGVGYHDLDGKYTFEKSDDSDSEKLYKSHLVLRPSIGVDIPFSKEYSILFQYSKSLFMNRSNVISIGLNIRT